MAIYLWKLICTSPRIEGPNLANFSEVKQLIFMGREFSRIHCIVRFVKFPARKYFLNALGADYHHFVNLLFLHS